MSQEQLCSLSGDEQKSSSAAQDSRALSLGGSESTSTMSLDPSLSTAAASSVPCGYVNSFQPFVLCVGAGGDLFCLLWLIAY